MKKQFKFRCPRRRPSPDCVGASNDPGDFYFYKSGGRKGRVYCCKPCEKAYRKRWLTVPENKRQKKAACAKWYAVPENKRWRKKYGERYRADPKNKRWMKTWRADPKNKRRSKAWKREYNALPRVKTSLRLHQKRRRACRPRWPNIKELLRPIEFERRAIMTLTRLMIEVDHIVQLQPCPIFIEGFGKVRPWTGLDVPWNIQHLTHDDHQAKHNGTGYAKEPIRLNQHGEVVRGRIHRTNSGHVSC